jgi:hypothetical protein
MSTFWRAKIKETIKNIGISPFQVRRAPTPEFDFSGKYFYHEDS